MSDVDNLWGELPEPDDMKSPTQILYEQGAILGTATKNVLIGTVTELSRSNDGEMRIRFDILAPALESYSYGLCSVEYDPIALYPADLYDETFDSRPASCADETEFRESLRAVLSSDRTKRVISALLRESKGPVGTRSSDASQGHQARQHRDEC